jgi:hypothetical protein
MKESALYSDLCIMLVHHALEDFMKQKIHFLSNFFLCYFGPELCDKVGRLLAMSIDDLRALAPMWLSKAGVREDRARSPPI